MRLLKGLINGWTVRKYALVVSFRYKKPAVLTTLSDDAIHSDCHLGCSVLNVFWGLWNRAVKEHGIENLSIVEVHDRTDRLFGGVNRAMGHGLGGRLGSAHCPHLIFFQFKKIGRAHV